MILYPMFYKLIFYSDYKYYMIKCTTAKLLNHIIFLHYGYEVILFYIFTNEVLKLLVILFCNIKIMLI